MRGEGVGRGGGGGRREGAGRWPHRASVLLPRCPAEEPVRRPAEPRRRPGPGSGQLRLPASGPRRCARPVCRGCPVGVPLPNPESSAWEGWGPDRSPAQPASACRVQPRRRRSAPAAALAANEGRRGCHPAGVSWAPPGGHELDSPGLGCGWGCEFWNPRAKLSSVGLPLPVPLPWLSSSARSLCEEGPPSRAASPPTPPVIIKSERLSPATGASGDFPRPYPYPLLLARPLAEPLRPTASLRRLTPDGWPR